LLNYTKPTALLGWLVYRLARRNLEHRLERAVGGRPRRRGLLAGIGLAAGAAVAVALWVRRGDTEPVGA
jgi:hypothetical protein